MQRLKGRVALITGAAGGIGAAVARRMAQEGAHVAVADMHDQAGEAVAHQIRLEQGDAVFLRLNVTRQEDWTAAIAAVVGRYGGLDVLVNNAGIYLAKGYEEASLWDWEKICSVNLTGVVIGTKLALPALRERARISAQGSAIINMSSVAGLKGSSVDPLYSLTKGGTTTFTKSLALEFGRKGYRIRANSVHPHAVETEMTAQARRATAADAAAAETSRQAAAMSLPVGRVGLPDDVAAAVAYLASDDAGYITGSSLVVDGGATA